MRKLLNAILVWAGWANRPMRHRLRCRLRFHRWTIWSSPESVDWTEEDRYGGVSTKTTKGVVDVQGRSCKDCGFTDKRYVHPRKAAK